jgi:hypothetical protein
MAELAQRLAAEERDAVRMILRFYSPDDKSARYLARCLADCVEDATGERKLRLAFLHEVLPKFSARLHVRTVAGRHRLTFGNLLNRRAFVETGLCQTHELLRQEHESADDIGPFGLVFRWPYVGLAVLHDYGLDPEGATGLCVGSATVPSSGADPADGWDLSLEEGGPDRRPLALQMLSDFLAGLPYDP